jgi:hypothetical protein
MSSPPVVRFAQDVKAEGHLKGLSEGDPGRTGHLEHSSGSQLILFRFQIRFMTDENKQGNRPVYPQKSPQSTLDYLTTHQILLFSKLVLAQGSITAMASIRRCIYGMTNTGECYTEEC